MKYAYYPGCSLHSTASEYDISFRSVCRTLHVAIEEIPKWACCGSTPAHSTSHLMALALSGRVISQAEEAKFQKILVPCASCFQRLKTAQYEVKNYSGLHETLEQVLDRKLENKAEVVHPLELFIGEEMSNRIADAVKKRLEGLKVCCYYGCLLTRPPKVMNFDECEYPMSMDTIISGLGAETLDWNAKTSCCGASLSLTKSDHVCKLIRDIFQEAKAVGANAIAVACPLCHSNLDTRQQEAETIYKEKYGLPIFYFTQLMGLAFGESIKALGLKKHLIDPMPLLSEVGIA